MAAYRLVYDSHHLQADCEESGSAPEPYARQSSMGYHYIGIFTVAGNRLYFCVVLWDQINAADLLVVDLWAMTSPPVPLQRCWASSLHWPPHSSGKHSASVWCLSVSLSGKCTHCDSQRAAQDSFFLNDGIRLYGLVFNIVCFDRHPIDMHRFAYLCGDMSFGVDGPRVWKGLQ